MGQLDKKSFIEQLAQDLEPVQPLWPSALRSSVWYVVMLVALCAVLWWEQPFRPQFWSDFGHVQFFVETALAFTSAYTLGRWVLLRAVPGALEGSLDFYLAVLPFLLFVLSLALGHYDFSQAMPTRISGARAHCDHEILIWSPFPVMYLSYLFYRGWGHLNWQVGLALGLGASSIPMALMQIACMYHPSHVLSYHVYPAILVTGVSIVLCVALQLWQRLRS